MNQHWRGQHRKMLFVVSAFILFSIQPLGAEEGKAPPWAIINGQSVTETDLVTINNGQTARTMQSQVYQARKQALETFITDQLLEQEAKKRGITRDQLVQQEVDAKIPAPGDAEVEQVYNANKERLGGKPLAEAKPTIISYLNSQKRQGQLQTFVRSLRRTAGVKLLLKPPLLNLTFDGAPTRGPATAPVTLVEFSDFQ